MGIQRWDPNAKIPLDEFEKLGWVKISSPIVVPGLLMPFDTYPGGVIRQPKVLIKGRYRWEWPRS